MNGIWIFLSIVFGAAVIALTAKVYLMKKSMREISEKLKEKLSTDTNTLIDISSADRDVRKLAADLNRELSALRNEQRRCANGDAELKTAITNISHDLRTPLTAMCGYLDLLDRTELPESARQYTTQIRNRADAMKTLTEELFRYSVAASASKPNLSQVCVNDLLEESAASFYGAISERGIIPEINICEQRIIRIADKSALLRIFSNIIGNALKYSNGNLIISLNEDCEIEFKNSADNLGLISVEKLFDRFYTVNDGSQSTGLGLSIAKRLTEQSGGQITARIDGELLVITVKL